MEKHTLKYVYFGTCAYIYIYIYIYMYTLVYTWCALEGPCSTGVADGAECMPFVVAVILSCRPSSVKVKPSTFRLFMTLTFLLS